MRIVIEHDTSRNTTTIANAPNIPAAAPGAGEAQPGGAGPGSGNRLNSAASRDTSAAADAGAPPQWLLDAVSAAQIAAGEGRTGRLEGFENGGAAPAAGGAALQGERT